MLHELSPEGIAPPAANYAHAILSEGVGRMVHTSGVVPVRGDGTVPEGIGEQAEVIWQTIQMLLADAHMSPANIVSVTTYIVADLLDSKTLQIVMSSRDRALAGHRAASTLLTVPALAQPAWKMEISVIAAA